MGQYIRDCQTTTIKSYNTANGNECNEHLQNMNFKIIHNVHSINENIDKFELKLQSISSKFDCIVLNEK